MTFPVEMGQGTATAKNGRLGLLDTPQRGDECTSGNGCISTSYQHYLTSQNYDMYAVFLKAVKTWNFRNNSIIYNPEVLERKAG